MNMYMYIISAHGHELSSGCICRKAREQKQEEADHGYLNVVKMHVFHYPLDMKRLLPSFYCQVSLHDYTFVVSFNN